MPQSALHRIVIPITFVILWSTGWVAAKFATQSAEPLTFLTLRFALAGLLIAGIAWGAGVRPGRGGAGRIVLAVVSGAFLHGLYLGGVWWAIGQGLPSGLSALITALQPLITVSLAPVLLGERISMPRIAGVVLGLAGLALALEPKLATMGDLGGLTTAILINVGGVVAITFGTFYQKRFLQGGDLRATAALQYFGALVVTVPLMLATERMHVVWGRDLAIALVWSVLVLSLGAIGLLLVMLRRGEVSRAATLIYLVPPLAALESWLLFGETMLPLQMAGMMLTVVGVALANR